MSIVFTVVLVVVVLWKQDNIKNIIYNKTKKKSCKSLYKHYYIDSNNTIVYFNETEIQKFDNLKPIKKGMFVDIIN